MKNDLRGGCSSSEASSDSPRGESSRARYHRQSMRAPTVGRLLGMVLAGVLLANGLSASDVAAPLPDVANVASRRHLTMNGDWRTIVDPYGNGHVDYRAQARGDGGFFKDARPKSPSDLVEYDFDTSPVLKVPGDWNTQRHELLYYEGTVWYRRRFESRARSRGAATSFTSTPRTTRARSTSTASVVGDARRRLHAVRVRGHGEAARRHELRRREGGQHAAARGRADRHTDWWNYGGLTRAGAPRRRCRRRSCATIASSSRADRSRP